MKLFAKPKAVNQVVLLETETVASNPFQPRKQFEPKALEELAESIAQNGLLQPVTVRQVGESSYQLISGERRLMACRLLGMTKIPAIIKEADDEKSAILALIENLQRRDLNYFEQAQGMQRLMEHYGMTQEQLAQRLGKAQPTVANKLRLLAFSEPLRRRMLDSGLTERHARALLRLPSEEMAGYVLERIIRDRLNVGETEQLVEALLSPKQEEPEKPSKGARLFVIKDMRIFMNTIAKAVDTMKQAGIYIDTQQEENEEYICYTMKIPKKSVYKSSHTA